MPLLRVLWNVPALLNKKVSRSEIIRFGAEDAEVKLDFAVEMGATSRAHDNEEDSDAFLYKDGKLLEKSPRQSRGKSSRFSRWTTTFSRAQSTPSKIPSTIPDSPARKKKRGDRSASRARPIRTGEKRMHETSRESQSGKGSSREKFSPEKLTELTSEKDSLSKKSESIGAEISSLSKSLFSLTERFSAKEKEFAELYKLASEHKKQSAEKERLFGLVQKLSSEVSSLPEDFKSQTALAEKKSSLATLLKSQEESKSFARKLSSESESIMRELGKLESNLKSDSERQARKKLLEQKLAQLLGTATPQSMAGEQQKLRTRIAEIRGN